MSDISALTPGTWTVDPTHSTVGFVARHLMVTKVRGRFSEFSGSITVGNDPLESTVQADVQLGSVSTGDENRDGHLKNADFFEVDANPTMNFTSRSITPKGGDYELAGDLTIKGITKPVVFDLEFEGVNTDPYGNTKAGFTATTDISRKEWGIEWNVALETGGVLVGDKVKIELDIQAAKAA
jgi:polyisoprenoid-binding protein YceI